MSKFDLTKGYWQLAVTVGTIIERDHSIPDSDGFVSMFSDAVRETRNFDHFSAMAAPLTDLTKKGLSNKVVWGEAQENGVLKKI